MTAQIPASALRKLTLIAIPIGVAAALGATLFLWLVEDAQRTMFEWLPNQLGMSPEPWWWSVIPLAVGTALIGWAMRLPSGTGGGPLGGFHFDVPFRSVPAALLAAFGSLAAGAALGPEAPLIIVGAALGGMFAIRSSDDTVRKALMFVGGIAAVAAVFGSPMVTAFMMLEFMALGAAPVALLIPGLVALATSYLTQIGAWSLPGLGVHSLSVPGLPNYPSIELGDFAGAAITAIAATVLLTCVRQLGGLLERIHNRTLILWLSAAAIAAAFGCAIAFSVDPSLVLFSGNSGMAALVSETTIAAVALVLVLKLIAVTASLGGGFRGGAIFPATFLGVAVGVLVHLMIPATGLAALAATGIAASAAVMTRLPATSSLLAVLLIAGTGPAIAPFAILGAVLGVFGRIASDKMNPAAGQMPAH